MANNSPTIVAASLSDDQLKKSIDSLVTHVDEAMKKMVQSTNNAVGEMEAKLKSLGNVRINSGGANDGGSSRRTSSVEKETKARKELVMTLDQQAAALDKASGKKKGVEYMSLPSDVDKNLTHLVNVNKDVDSQMDAILKKEQALIDAKQKEAQVSEQIASAQRAANSVRGVSAYDLGIDPNVSAGRARQKAGMAAAAKETEYLKQQVASLLEVEEREIKTANTTSSSYAQLAQYLKNLQSAYQRLGADRIAKGEGTDLANEIQRTQRAMQKLQQTMSRPVSLKDAMGLSEKTLDDIAYKIRMLQSYMQGLDATNKKSAEEFKRAALNVEILKNKQNELLAKNAQLIGSNNSLIRSNTALGRSWNYMKNRLAFYFTVGASTQFVKNLIEIRSQYEMTERALGILVNSAERGTQIFNELSQMALVSPYTLIELSGAAKQLVAYDVAAKDVVDTTRRLADMASAVGVPMERLTYALGQIKAYGYLNSRDNRMFANAGIPLVKQLADYYTELDGKLVSTADVYDRIKKKAVGYADVMQVITKMTDEGGKFFDFQEKMSGTLKVQIANLTLAWNNMLNEIGASEQGILTAGIAGLKNLFLAWKDLSNILTTIAAIFGIVKAQQILSNIAIGKSTVSLIGYINANKEATWVEYSRALQTKKLTATQAAWLLMTNKNNAALAASLVRLKIIDATTARYLTTMKGLSAGLLQLRIMGTMALSGLAKGVKALGAAFMTNLPLVALTAAIDLFTHLSSVASNNKSFNESIATGANEASEALRNFMKEEDKVQARAKAASGNLSDTEAKKVWEAIREQIELSSQAANIFIPQLLSITDINERITAAFDLADKIQEATNKLGELRDEMEVSQDSWLWGLFGEGIGEDLDDYNKRVKELREQAKYFAEGETSVWEDLKIAINGVWDGIGGGSGSQGAKEAVREIEKFANNAADVIKEKLGKEGVLDEKQVTETVARFVKAAEQQIPEIRGAGKKLFEALTNDIMGKQFEVFNAQEYYYSAFLEQLKKDYGSKFSDITEDIKDKTVVWSDAQKKAIKETADKVKKDWPQASRDAIDEILKDLNNTEFKLHLIATFSTELTDFQQQFNTRANKLGMIIADTLQKFAPQSGDDLPSWTKKQQESIKALREENKNYEKDNSEWAKQRIAANNTEIEGRKKALSLFKQSAISDKDAAKNKKQVESELQKALKDELSTIDKVRSIYKDLTKEGMSHADAVERATRGWGETVNAINKVLQKNGLQKLDLSKFAGIENPRELVNMLQSQLNVLVGRGAKPAEIKELQTKIQTLNVDAEKYDLTKITKGLNNELGKLKDEYELAVELDANPELGDMFADMFGINTSTLPKTFGDALDRAQIIINRKLAEMNITTPFDLMEGNIDSFAKSTGLDKDGAVIKELVSAQNAYRDMFKKNITETEKMLDDYIKKYGDYSDKIAEIEAGRLEKLKKLNEAYYTEEMRKRPEYIAKLNAIEQGASKEKQQVDFDDFKNSRYYTMMFENLDYISTKTIRDMRDRVREPMDTMNDLTPEQLKTLMSQYEKLEQKLVKRSPFKTLTKDLKEYFATTKERKAANVEFKNAQKEYDVQKKKVTALKENFEQLKRIKSLSPEMLISEAEEVNNQQKILDKLKEQLDAAQKKADKYNLTSKLAKSEALAVANVVGQNLQSLGELRDFLQQDLGIELSDELNGLVDGLSKVGQGINKITSSATSGDIVGVITGVGQTIYGLYDGIASLFGGGGASDKKITKQIQDSERAVKRLELAYIDLEHAVQQAYGMATIGANMAAKANKELQLVELKRQLALERSRDSKDRDEDKIIDLQKQIKELEYDIKDATDAIVNDLLGISSVGNAAETLVTNMIAAFKKGEQFMDEYKQTFDDMIDNMIMKAIVSNVIGNRLQEMFDRIQQTARERAKKEEEAYDSAYKEFESLSRMGNIVEFYNFDPYADKVIGDKNKLISREEWEELWKKRLEFLKKQYEDAMTPTPDDVQGVRDDMKNWRDSVKEEFMAYMDAFGVKYGQDSTKQLSALQQGIQGITEDTAGALEGITNGISQQCYLQSDILIQIRDTVQSFDIDVQLGVFSQMLLQLQNNYIVMQSMQSMMEGWTTPSGQGIRVELLS